MTRVPWLCSVVMLLSLPVIAQDGTTTALATEAKRAIFLKASSELKTGAGRIGNTNGLLRVDILAACVDWTC